MKDVSWCYLALISLLLAGVFFAGCSGEEPAGAATPVPTTVSSVKFAAGDIIARSAQATDNSYYLIIGYDRATDQYDRAWIYRNSDGSFGYRLDSRTDKSPRATMEKVYPFKISHVTVSSIPIVTPTVPAAVTTTSGNPPTLQKISPSTGSKDSTVTVTITGSNFQSGATVKFLQPGYSPIKATAVSVTSPKSIDCTFNLEGLGKGKVNLVVANPDGQSDSLVEAFTIGTAGPVITSVSPGSYNAGGTGRLTVYGQNFQDLFKVSLSQGSQELDCINPLFYDTTKISCDLVVPATAKTGSWSLSVINVADQQTGQYLKPVTITNST